MEKAYDVRYLPIVGLLRKLHALRSYEVLIGIEEFIDLYCIVLTSGFEWQHLDSPWNGVGTAFDPLIAATNHSCDPNTTIIDYDIAVRKDLPCNQACDRCMGHVVVLRALRRIRVGDQITISYSSARLARHLRRDTLKSMYYFDCRCQACRATDAIEEASFCPNCNRPFSLVAQRFKTVMNNGSEELDLGVVEQVWPTMLVDPSEGTNGYLREVASLGLDFLKQPPELAAGAVIDIDDESELSEVEKRLVETVTDPIVNCPRCKFACDWRAGELSAMAFQELLTRLMNNAAADEEDEPMTPDQRRAFEQELSEGFQRVLTQNNSYFFGRNITKRVADRLQAASQHAWYNGSCKDAQKAVLLSIFVVNEVEGVQALKRAEIDIEITGSRYDWLPICPSFTLSLYFGIFRVLDYLSWLDMFMQSQNGNLPTISAMAGFPSMAEFLRFNRIIVRLVHMWYAFVKKYEALSIEANHLRASYGLNDRHIAVISIRLARFGLEPDKNTPVEAIAQYLFDLTVESFGAEPSERICNLLTWRIISAVNEL
ncbi:hypothetical protein TRVA0_018S01354 [Trichomonascus vanleenenianus]|uniref:SET domain-containing protein n=1 Tax=Trichomonascus vanleenenianus TaxID=2268995 RepID=UPI003EC966AE